MRQKCFQISITAEIAELVTANKKNRPISGYNKERNDRKKFNIGTTFGAATTTVAPFTNIV